MFWKTIGAIGTTAVVGMMSLTTSTRAAVGGPALTAVPCPDTVWQDDNPTFEALPGARASFGRYEGGIYRVEIPDTWNGELVLWAHGFAWAASSYRCNGYVPGIGLLDTLALRDVFTKCASIHGSSFIS